jgi:hypothetical protein
MLLSAVFERFVEKSPVSVMVEGTLQNALHASLLDELFERTAQQQYTRHLLFSTLTDLMCQVVCGVRTSIGAAHQARSAQSAVALTSVYNKLNGDEGERVFLRRVLLDWDEPTRDGDTQLAVLTNLPEADAAARAVGRLYRRRWTTEAAFAELAQALNGESNTLCYPRAALFAFCCALVAYNVLGVVQGALRGVHGQAKAEEISGYYLADEIAGTRRGMLIAIPEEHWAAFRGATPAEMAEVLRTLASKVRLAAFRRHRRGDKKPPVKRTYDKDHPHVSTARLLEERRRKKKV